MIPTTATALALLAAFVLPGFIVVQFQERTFKQREELAPLAALLRSLYYSGWCYLLLVPVALIFHVDTPYVKELVRDYGHDPAQLVWRAALAMFVPALVIGRSTLFMARLRATLDEDAEERGARREARKKLSKRQRVAHALGISSRHQQPTAWDFWFEKGFKSTVKLTFGDGNVIWGYYGQDSFASYAKDGLDLYLQCIYRTEPSEAVAPVGRSWRRVWCAPVQLKRCPSAPGNPHGARDTDWFTDPREESRGGWVRASEAISIEFYDFANDT